MGPNAFGVGGVNGEALAICEESPEARVIGLCPPA